MTKIELLTKLTELLKENRKSVEDRERLTHNRLTGPLSNRLALFGIGGLGRRTLRGLRNAGVEPLAFCDNNKRLWGHKVEGLKVLPPKQAVKTLANKASFIVTIWNRSEGHPLHSVEAQLNLHGKAIVASFIPLYWKYEEFFLSYFSLDKPSTVLNTKIQILRLAKSLADSWSRRNYLSQIEFKLSGELFRLQAPVRGKQYFPKKIFTPRPNEIFVDVGAFNGETLKEFLKVYKCKFKKYIAFESDHKNYSLIKKYLHTLKGGVQKKIKLYSKGVSNFTGKAKFFNQSSVGSLLSKAGNCEVGCVKLDNIIKNEKPSFIKIVTEGKEHNALQGCSRRISQNHPILAVAAYHKPGDIWKIGLYILSPNPSYKAFLGAYALGVGKIFCISFQGRGKICLKW